MPDFATFRDTLLDRLRDLVEDQWADHRDAALTDGRAFLAATEADLTRWTALLEEGALTPEDFTWLVQGRRDLAEMAALQQAGLALARLDRFRASLLDTVVGTAFDVFL